MSDLDEIKKQLDALTKLVVPLVEEVNKPKTVEKSEVTKFPITEIKGIGEARAEQLATKFGVKTLEDLASFEATNKNAKMLKMNHGNLIDVVYAANKILGREVKQNKLIDDMKTWDAAKYNRTIAHLQEKLIESLDSGNTSISEKIRKDIAKVKDTWRELHHPKEVKAATKATTTEIAPAKVVELEEGSKLMAELVFSPSSTRKAIIDHKRMIINERIWTKSKNYEGPTRQGLTISLNMAQEAREYYKAIVSILDEFLEG